MSKCAEIRGAGVLKVEGRIDASAAPGLEEELCALHETNTHTIILDLAGASYSSSGLRVLLFAHRRQQSRGGELLLRDLSPRILGSMCLCGFDRVLTLIPDSARQEAQASQ